MAQLNSHFYKGTRNYVTNEKFTHPNLLFYELPSIVYLLWSATNCKKLHIRVCVRWRVSLKLYSCARLLAYAFYSFTS